MTRAGSDAAFTLAELLVAMGITLAVCAAALALVAPATDIFLVQPEVHDLQQRLRVAAETLRRDLYAAGAGLHEGWAAGPLHLFVAPVRPSRVGELRPDAEAGVFHRPDVVSVMTVPPTVAQAVVRRLSWAGRAVAVDAESNCGSGARDRLCGFQAGMRVLLLDRWGRSAAGTVTAIDGHTVHVDSQDVRGDLDWRAGAALAEIDLDVYGIGVDPASGAPRLMHYDGRRTELPVVDHVVGLAFEYFADPAPPLLLPDVDLEARAGPWTTYGPAPPPLAVDVPGDLWGAGENCVFTAEEGGHVPRLPRLAAGGALVRLEAAWLADGPWCPDAAHPARFDADLLRVRRVRLVMRLEAASDRLRGAAGPLFVRPGTAASMRQHVPDQEVQFDVSPRNLNLAR